MSDATTRGGAKDTDLSTEVARIKRDIPYSGSYRKQIEALLAVLFFKFGERPGANRVSALLAENGRSPSTSTAQDEINKFWDNVRKNSAISIDRPDVPEPLLRLLGDFAGKAWQLCMAEAQVQYESHHQDAAAKVEVAQAAVNHAQDQVTQARVAAAQMLRELQVANESREGLSRQVAREVSKGEELRNQIAMLTGQLAQEKQSRSAEAQQTQAALGALKEAQEAAVDEQRRLMTIGDEFKQQASRERALRAKVETAQTQLASENEELRKQLALLTHERGVLAGTSAAQATQIAALTLQLSQRAEPTAAVPRKKMRPGLRKQR